MEFPHHDLLTPATDPSPLTSDAASAPVVCHAFGPAKPMLASMPGILEPRSLVDAMKGLGRRALGLGRTRLVLGRFICIEATPHLLMYVRVPANWGAAEHGVVLVVALGLYSRQRDHASHPLAVAYDFAAIIFLEYRHTYGLTTSAPNVSEQGYFGASLGGDDVTAALAQLPRTSPNQVADWFRRFAGLFPSLSNSEGQLAHFAPPAYGAGLALQLLLVALAQTKRFLDLTVAGYSAGTTVAPVILDVLESWQPEFGSRLPSGTSPWWAAPSVRPPVIGWTSSFGMAVQWSLSTAPSCSMPRTSSVPPVALPLQ